MIRICFFFCPYKKSSQSDCWKAEKSIIKIKIFKNKTIQFLITSVYNIVETTVQKRCHTKLATFITTRILHEVQQTKQKNILAWELSAVPSQI